MIESDQIGLCQSRARTIDPPSKSIGLHCPPVVDRVAPSLAGAGKAIRRNARDELWPAILIEQKEMRVRPNVARLGGDEDRQITNQAHASFSRAISQRFELPEKNE